ncbi:MAG: hypothetical protein R6X29_10890 [Acidimicrobiia bacterium]|jgi:hypothetical protein
MRFPLVRSVLVTEGVNRTLRGIHTGDQRTFYVGAAILGVLWLQRAGRPRRYLLRQEVIPDGGAVVIRSGRGDAPPLTVSNLAGEPRPVGRSRRVRAHRIR